MRLLKAIFLSLLCLLGVVVFMVAMTVLRSFIGDGGMLLFFIGLCFIGLIVGFYEKLGEKNEGTGYPEG